MSTSIIHLSDIHIKSENDSIFSKKEELINTCINNVSNKDNIIIVFSGDIAYSGKESQYKLATDFINELMEQLALKGVNAIQVLCVPGNHDCDFDNKSKVRDALIKHVAEDGVD